MMVKMKTVICICLLCAFALVPAFSVTGEVVLVRGRAEVQRGGAWSALNVGDSVDSGSVISTGFRSQVVIKVAESTITVDALSRLTLEQLTEKDDGHDSEVYLNLGSISASVHAAENKRVGFVVNTPIATASVRGTEFSVNSNSISVQSGTVAVTGNGANTTQNEILVENGSAVTIEADYIAPPQITRAKNASDMGGDLPSTEEVVGGSYTGGSSSNFGDSGNASGSINVSLEY